MPQYLEILHKWWGYPDFRGIQREIIESIGSGHDTLGLMPTGGGKSITFQVPALALPGICIVVTPLIALMKDQVNHLRQKGIKAEAIYAGLTREQIITILENCIYGDFKFLYISPERLSSELFISKLRSMHVNFITVDEAHCISQWGYDFRPSYLKISQLRTILPSVPILALTATATPTVANDIQRQLGFRNQNIFRMTFERLNLSYIVKNIDDKESELLSILTTSKSAAIVYVRTREQSRKIAEFLTQNGIPSIHYHAGLDMTDKDIRQRMWQQDKIRVIVATNAFGMGIDKPDVRFVIHLAVPDSPEAYFQEAGRAGRDGEPSWAILLYNKTDRTTLLRRIPETFPELPYIKRLYEDIACFYQIAVGDGRGVTKEFEIGDFCRKFHYFPVPVENALHILTNSGYLDYKDEDAGYSRIFILLRKEDLYQLRNMSLQAETLIKAILRNYGGVFSGYVAIDESYLAQQIQSNPERVYTILKNLNQSRILHYIPRKSIPHITYTQRRLETQELVFLPENYSQRKESYKNHISAILEYAESNECRSKWLLTYFGEQEMQECGHCDICHPIKEDVQNISTISKQILNILSDGKEHWISEILWLPFVRADVGMAVRELLDQGRICTNGACIRLVKLIEKGI